MRTQTALGILFLTAALLLLVSAAFGGYGDSSGETFYVDDDAPEGGDGSPERPFGSIQDAVNASGDGDTVRVWEGMYYENVVVDRSVTLAGNGSADTWIDGGRNGDVVQITADWVNMSGFTVKGSGVSWHHGGIEIRSNHTNIFENNCSDNTNGILLYGDLYGDPCGTSNNTIAGNLCPDNVRGIYLYGSGRNNISDNNCTGNYYGISLKGSSSNVIARNICLDNHHGMYSVSSGSNLLVDNVCSGKEGKGMSFYRATRHTLSGNRMYSQGLFFYMDSLDKYNSLSHLNTHDIDITNTLDGKPIYYYKNTTGGTVPPGAAQVILVNCTRMVVENLDYTGSSSGILVGYSSEISIAHNSFSSMGEHGIYLYRSVQCNISENNCSNNDRGIVLHRSDHNNLSDNICSSNGYSGIYMISSYHNTLTRNTCASNRYYGIYCSRSGCNTFSINDLRSNGRHGICLSGSSYSTIESCTFTGNSVGGVSLSYSDDNIIAHSDFSNNQWGIRLGSSTRNDISGNAIYNNSSGIRLESSSGNALSDNRISGNHIGLWANWNAGGNTVMENRIYDNTRYGLVRISYGDNTTDEGNRFNAANNYWGSDSGPYHSTGNPNGSGDNISSDFVDFRPWLNEDGAVNRSSAIQDEKPGTVSPEHIRYLLIGLSIFLMGNLAILTYAAYNSEALRYRILHLFLPLYSRINEKHIEKDIRQQNIRGRIYQYIRDHPGMNFTGIMKAVSIGNGTTVYHLSVLEREGYIRSAVSGNRKLFWSKAEFPGMASAALTDVGRRIVELLRERGRMSRAELLDEIGISRSTLHAHIKELVENGSIVVEKQGKSHYCSLEEMNREACKSKNTLRMRKP